MNTACLHQYPYIRLIIPWIAGVFCGDWFFDQSAELLWSSLAFCLLTGLSIAFYYLERYSLRWCFGVSVFALCFAGGWGSISWQLKQTVHDFPEKETVYRVQLTDTPEAKERTLLCRVWLEGQHDSSYVCPIGRKAILYLQKDSLVTQLKVGDELFVSVRIRRISIQTGIHGGVNKRRGKQWGRNLMLGIQFFICWIFVSFTVALFLQSEKTTQTLFHTLNQKEKEAILSIPLDYSFMKNEEKLSVVERFQQHAGVKDVLLADIAYTQGVSGNLLMTEKENDNSWTDINIMCVPLNFFAFMNIPIEEGRTIRTKNDLVMDKVWQNKQKKNVIGMNFYDQNNDYTVCGVCTPFQADVHYHSGGYAFMLYDPSEYVGHCYVKCYPEQQKEVVKWIEKIRREVLPENISYQVRTFQDDLYEIQAMEYMLKDTILFFAIVSIIITLLGVYSSITLDTERRQKEVAIRIVNGARMSHIIWLFTRLYITLLMVTAALSFPLVYLVLQLWKQIYTVFFNCGFWFWTGIFISVAMITALTIWFRILKIARVNPVEAIKNE